MSTNPVTPIRTKTCKNPECDLKGQPQPIDNFHWKSKRRGTRQSHCKVCMSKYGHQHYVANSDQYKERANNRLKTLRATNRELVKNWISSHPCQKCQEANPKKLVVSVNSNEINNMSTEDLTAKLVNSMILCRNCQVLQDEGFPQ